MEYFENNILRNTNYCILSTSFSYPLFEDNGENEQNCI